MMLPTSEQAVETPSGAQVMRRCGRFILIHNSKGFHWELAIRGAAWCWHAESNQWLAVPGAYRSEEEATLGLKDSLAYEQASNLDKEHLAPRTSRP
jgi:hypothetical protein